MNNERKISPKEFSDKRKSQDDEILKKQLELREREIALKEKELELRILQAQGGENSVEKEKIMIEREKFQYAKYSMVVFIILITFFVISVVIIGPMVNRQEIPSIIRDIEPKKQLE